MTRAHPHHERTAEPPPRSLATFLPRRGAARRRGVAAVRLGCIATVAIAATQAAVAADPAASVFGEVGAGDRSVESATLGATRSFRSDAARADSRWDVYGELSVGRWKLKRDASGKSTHATQFGLTPVVRYSFGPSPDAFFVEGGIGANAITPILHSDGRAFSTIFNFGDHVGVGKRFGVAGENELALRVQHFSNAGIKRPNPGEDFVQLRFARRF